MTMFKSLQLIALIVALSSFKRIQCADSENRIVGGSATNVQRVPYLVRLVNTGTLRCGGSLVTRRFVVTAAHCTDGLRASDITVVGGATYQNRGGVTRSVTKIIQHPRWNSRTRANDIAILKLNAPMRGNNIRTIPLCRSNWRRGNKVTIAGFGRTRENGGNTSNQLRIVQLPVVGKAQCRRRYRGAETLTNSMFCTLKAGKDSCQGDSGGPVVFNNQLCGVVSWGYGCARARYPGVNTSIRATRGFILRTIRNNS